MKVDFCYSWLPSTGMASISSSLVPRACGAFSSCDWGHRKSDFHTKMLLKISHSDLALWRSLLSRLSVSRNPNYARLLAAYGSCCCLFFKQKYLASISNCKTNKSSISYFPLALRQSLSFIPRN